MISACKTILECTQYREWDEFVTNKMLQDALLYEIAIIGEAANNVPRDYAEVHAEIPWASIAGMRHRVIHDYGHVNLQTVWATATTDVPDILAKPSDLNAISDNP